MARNIHRPPAISEPGGVSQALRNKQRAARLWVPQEKHPARRPFLRDCGAPPAPGGMSGPRGQFPAGDTDRDSGRGTAPMPLRHSGIRIQTTIERPNANAAARVKFPFDFPYPDDGKQAHSVTFSIARKFWKRTQPFLNAIRIGKRRQSPRRFFRQCLANLIPECDRPMPSSIPLRKIGDVISSLEHDREGENKARVGG